MVFAVLDTACLCLCSLLSAKVCVAWRMLLVVGIFKGITVPVEFGIGLAILVGLLNFEFMLPCFK